MAESNSLIQLTADIVSSMVGNNNVAAGDVPALIKSVHGALSGLGTPAAEPESERPKGAVSARASIKPDGLISMIDGKKYQTLRRHITRHGYTPETYRETFGLPRDYPLTSANYSELRRGMAKMIGLGRKSADAAIETVSPAAEEEPAKPARKPRATKAAAATPDAAPVAPEASEADAPETRAAEAPSPDTNGAETPAKPKRGRPRKAAAEATPPADAVSGGEPEFFDPAPAPKKRGKK